jgi:protein-S-isoprenylcysteine O-methyltransferase Ste14
MSERAHVKTGKASLIGGIAVAIAVLVLWTAVAHELSVDSLPMIGLGLLVAAGIGTWIRMADL